MSLNENQPTPPVIKNPDASSDIGKLQGPMGLEMLATKTARRLFPHWKSPLHDAQYRDGRRMIAAALQEALETLKPPPVPEAPKSSSAMGASTQIPIRVRAESTVREEEEEHPKGCACFHCWEKEAAGRNTNEGQGIFLWLRDCYEKLKAHYDDQRRGLKRLLEINDTLWAEEDVEWRHALYYEAHALAKKLLLSENAPKSSDASSNPKEESLRTALEKIVAQAPVPHPCSQTDCWPCGMWKIADEALKSLSLPSNENLPGEKARDSDRWCGCTSQNRDLNCKIHGDSGERGGQA